MTCVVGRSHRRLRRAVRAGATARRRRRHAGGRRAGAAGAQHGLRRRARRRRARAARHRAGGRGARRDASSPLDALDAILRRAPPAAPICAAVVASQGHYDEEALEAILKCGVPYVGLVASRKRGATVRALLEERGVPGVDDDPESGGARSRRADAAGSRAVDPRRDRPGASERRASGGGTTAAAPSPAAAAASVGDRRRSGLRHERGRRLGAPHGGGRRRRRTTSAARIAARKFLKDPQAYLGPPMTDAAAIHDRFRERGFIVDEAFATALQIMLALEKPLLVEGPAGVGKTESAKVLAEVLGTRADPPAVLRRARRDGGALRVELSAPDAPRAPERDGRFQPRRARSVHVQRAVPAQAAAARRDHARSVARCCSSTKSIAPTRPSRRSSSRCWRSGRSRSPSSARSARGTSRT